MKKIIIIASIMFASATGLRAETLSFDYYGFPVSIECEITPVARRVNSFELTVSKNLNEMEKCYKKLDDFAQKNGIADYSLVLLFDRFVKSLKRDGRSPQWISFADVVKNGQALSKRDEVAMLYALIARAGIGIQAIKTGRDYHLILHVDTSAGESAEIDGYFFGDDRGYYSWQPGKPFGDADISASTVTIVLATDGTALKFDNFTNLPFKDGKKGSRLDFRSPEGCPKEWNFSRYRLPDYEAFVDNWPRGYILGGVSYKMMSPFELDAVFKPFSANMDAQAFGNCLFQWVQLNTEYVEQGDSSATQHPVITFSKRGGDCDELSYLLIAVLMAGGFPCDHIRMAVWDEDLPTAHMNVAVSPLSDGLDLSEEDGCVPFAGEDGRDYYVMDVAFYITMAESDERVLVNWGCVREDLPETGNLYTLTSECE